MMYHKIYSNVDMFLSGIPEIQIPSYYVAYS
jgi:hypothetical protein